MKITEIRGLSDGELENKITETRKASFRLRLREVNGQVKNTAEIKSLRRELARFLTVQRERQLGIQHKTAKAK